MKNCRSAEALLVDATHADQERVGAGAAGQTRGFGVEKGPALWDASGMAPPESGSSRSSAVRSGSKFHAAVAAVAPVELLRFEVLAARGQDYRSADELFDEVTRGA